MSRLISWLLLALGASTLVVVACMSRYEMFTGAAANGLPGNFSYVVWDRWQHRVCFVKFDRGIACSLSEVTARFFTPEK